MTKPMTDGQRLFWKGILAFARATRRGKNVGLEVAADALALEQEVEQRLASDASQIAPAPEPIGVEVRH